MTLIKDKDNVTITIPSSFLKDDDVQRLLDYIRYKALVSKSKAKQSGIDKLATGVNKQWWKINKNRFIKK